MLSMLPTMFSTAMLLMPIADPAASIPSPSHALLTAPDRRVRAADVIVQAMLTEGLRRSPTFASLMTALNRRDVIVYIERSMTLPRETMGRLTIVPGVRDQRYLRIQIRADLSRGESIALIGHEMTHAMEIADEPEVRGPEGVIKLYERIGHSSGGLHVYDTVAAQDAGRKVRREMTG
ncbi:MAG TPA: hypothetical protein VFJ02_16185 [Vicinamibacterales bacterium]|nr:hypothetical protein [Vicinamibacterales bacterium]